MHSFTHDDALSTDPVFALLHLHGSDLLTSDGMQIEKSLSHHGSISCYDHSVAVARMSIYLALKLRVRVDMRSMIRGALLHDYFLYDWRDGEEGHDLHGFKHALASVALGVSIPEFPGFMLSGGGSAGDGCASDSSPGEGHVHFHGGIAP